MPRRISPRHILQRKLICMDINICYNSVSAHDKDVEISITVVGRKAVEIIMEPKKQSESLSILAQMVLPSQANPAGNVHGGEIMKMMDSTAGVAAQKHSRTNAVTARVDELCFRKPILVGELVTCTAQVIYAGHSSMEIFVSVESEDLSTGRQQIALTAFFTMVALDSDGHPHEVAPIEFSYDNIYEQKLYLEGQKRYLLRKEGHSKKEAANGRKK